MVKIGQAYNNMNKFLAAFLDHVCEWFACRIEVIYIWFEYNYLFKALKDLDYEIREKTFVEKLLGIEYSDPLDKGVFFVGENISIVLLFLW